MKIAVCAVVVALLVVTAAFGQNRGVPPAPAVDYEAIRKDRVATAFRIHEKITLDGQLEEAAWRQAVPVTDFLQWSPRHGELSPERTEVRILYDDNNLYVAFTNYDSDMEHAVVKELKEDFNFQESDGVGISIDSLHDLRSGFSFGVNIAGAKRDQQIANDSQFNMDWDAVWDAKVTTNDQSWIAEFVIPLKTLRFSNSPSQVWGLNMNRRILRRNEESMWSLTPQRYRISRMSQAGTLIGLENVHQGRNLKVTPYTIANLTQVRPNATAPMRTLKSLTRVFCTDAHPDCGYNGGVDLKYSLTSSLTLDATYRTDFAQVEVDQQQVNLTRFNLFFPEKRDFFLENSGIFNFGQNQVAASTTSTSAANLVPFFSRSIGLNAAGTPIPIIGGGRVTGQIKRYDVGFITMKTDSLGSTPSSTYAVGRVKRNLLRNSWIGTLVTSRDSTVPGDYNRVYGADAHFQFFTKLDFDSFLMRSDSPNRPGRNYAKKFQTAWRDDELNAAFEYNTVQANFNPEVGFVRRKELTQYSGDFSYRPLLKSDTVKNLNFSTSADYTAGSESRKVETRTQEGTLGIQFQNNGAINYTILETFDRIVKDFLIRPDIKIAPGDYRYMSHSLTASTGSNRKVSVNGNVGGGGFWDGSRRSFGGGVIWSPSPHFGLDLSFSRNRVRLQNGSFTTQLFGTRVIYAINPKAFLNAFVQYNADTHQVSSNIRFDLMHRPLSHLYVVYNERRDTITDVLLERAVIVKLTNLFSF